MRRPMLSSVLPAVAVLALAAGCSSAASDGAGGTDPTPSSTTAGSSAAGAAPAVRSAGCDAARVAAGRTTETVASGGEERTYLRSIPTGLTADQAAPLILDLTAYSPASMEESFSGFTTKAADGTVKADQEGIVVITPEPTNGAGTLLTWNYVGTEGWSDDQAFVTDLLDEVEATVCIDTSRVFLTGFAVGGVFGSITACEQTDRFAALATVSGLYSPEDCDPSKPLPVISFHGTGDRFIPFDGGIGSGPEDLPLSPETIEGLTFMAGRDGALASSEAWAGHDGCGSEADEAPVTDGVTLRTWSGCDDGTAVELYEIEGGEHTWPGSTGMGDYTALLGPVSDQIDATDLIWDFFTAQTT
ncbi:MAG: putative hydrolase [Ilumatobacteraceae bacterium]|nr:putative hydrolase [Ilumatobacteraceae bacterium]